MDKVRDILEPLDWRGDHAMHLMQLYARLQTKISIVNFPRFDFLRRLGFQEANSGNHEAERCIPIDYNVAPFFQLTFALLSSQAGFNRLFLSTVFSSTRFT